MGGSRDDVAYWDTVGATKTFTHPVRLDWLRDVPRDERVLDYGCGYGRVLAELAAHGFSDLAGVDVSPSLVARARRVRADVRVEVLRSPPALPAGFDRYGLVLLIAVLTCVVEDDAQRALVAAVTDVLEPGGLLVVSDLLLQESDGYRARYAAHRRATGAPHGVFATGDGGTCRHHDPAHLRALVAHLEVVEECEVDVLTMNGNPVRAVQLLLRKPRR